MKIAQDKLMHLLSGAVITLALMQIHLLVAVVAIITIAIGKELRDRLTKKGTPDRWDIVATVIGGALAFAWSWFLEWFITVI
ncbi:MAG: hypothetical protein ACK5LV_11200 [Lachnospirales bacterium]